MTLTDTSEPPFALNLITWVVDLPIPPSTNNIWRRAGSGMRLSDEYRNWKDQADRFALAQCRGRKPIMGSFEAHVSLNEAKSRGDIDNRTKALLDWAQSRCLISNDKNCRKLIVEYGEAPEGCRLTLRELAPDTFVSLGDAAARVLEKISK